jgi:hypothetical protein
MSVETSRFSQSGDSDPDDGQRRFAFRSADSAADPADLDDDLDDDAVSRDDADADDEDGDTVVRGTVVDEDEDADEDAADLDATDLDAGDVEPQPTFTPVADGSVADGPVAYAPDPSEPTLSETDGVPVVPAQSTAPVAAVPVAATAAVPVAATAAAPPPLSPVAVDANEPLLGDPVGLRASWQQAQAGFVDDPRAAVADAAELIEHTAQTLIGSLQQRQRQLRTQWDDNGSTEVSDTEQLRHLMQDYRSLFNQLVQP